MKRTVKVLTLTFVFALLLTIGCFSAFAADPAPITVAAGATETINGESFTNLAAEPVTLVWNSVANKYVLGTLTVTTHDVTTGYNGTYQNQLTVYNADNSKIEAIQVDVAVNQDGVNPSKLGLTSNATYLVNEMNAGDYPNAVTLKWFSDTSVDYTDWYHIVYVYGTFTIEQTVVDVVWTDTTLTFNNGVQVPTATATTIDGHVVPLNPVTGGKTNVGNYTAAVTSADPNYTLTNTTTSYEIVPQSVAVVWSNTTLTFNNGVQAPTASAVDAQGIAVALEAVTGGATNVGDYTANVVTLDGNYTLTNTSTAYDIIPQSVAVVWSNTTLIFNNGVQAPTASAVDAQGIAVVLEAVVGGQTNVGNAYPASVATLDGNYVLTNASVAYDIIPQSVAVVWTNTTLIFNNAVQAPVASAVDAQGVVVSLEAVTGGATNVGDYTANVTTLDNNYVLTNTSTPYAIKVQVLTVVWDNLDLTYNGTAQAPTASATSAQGLPFTLTVAGAQINAGTSYVAFASFADTNYALTNNAQPFVIKKAVVTVTTGSATQVYDGSTLIKHTYEVTDASGVVVGDVPFTNVQFVSSITWITAANKVDTAYNYNGADYEWYGLVKNAITYDADSNYQLTVIEGDLIMLPMKGMIFSAQGYSATKMYDGTPLEYTGTTSYVNAYALLVKGDRVSTIGDSHASVTNVHDALTFEASIRFVHDDGLGNVFEIYCYETEIDGSGVSLTITPRPITVEVADVTVIYGNAFVGAGYDVLPTLYGSDTWNFTNAAYAHTYTVTTGVGTYAVTVEGLAINTPDIHNYVLTIEGATLNVVKRDITVTADDKTTVYGSEAPAFTFTAINVANGDILNIVLDDNYTAIVDGVGPYTITASATVDANPNYNITFKTGTLTVTPKNITVTADNKLTVYGEAAPAFTYTVVGLVGTDTLTNPIYTCAYVAGNNAGTYSIGVTVDADSNYTYAYNDGVLTVRPFTISDNIVWDGATVVTYNGTAQAPIAYATYGATTVYFTTTAATYVGEHVLYITGVDYVVNGDMVNFRVNKLTADECYFTVKEATPVVFKAASVTVGDTYAVNFKVDAVAINQYGGNFSVTMNREGFGVVTLTQDDVAYVADGGVYVFTYTNVGPQSMGVAIEATLNVADQADTREYSIADYCYNMMLVNAHDDELLKVLVAMLRYGEAAQLQTNFNTNALVTDKLENDPAYAKFNAIVTEKASYDNIRTMVYDDVKVKPSSAVKLDNGVLMQHYAKILTPVDGAVYTIEVTKNGMAVPATVAVDANGRYYVECEVNFAECSDVYLFTVYEDSTVISETTMSIETYAALTGLAVAERLVDFGTLLADYIR